MIDMMDADGEQNAYKASNIMICLMIEILNIEMFFFFADARIASDSYSVGDNSNFPKIVQGKFFFFLLCLRTK